jgi:hypothetical protein
MATTQTGGANASFKLTFKSDHSLGAGQQIHLEQFSEHRAGDLDQS